VVYTWVDGGDPEWQKVRAHMAVAYTGTQAVDGNAQCRFRNHDELKYSLRSLWKFAPFINHIYIVTCGQTPQWLQAHPKITIVNHKEIFLNKTDLPTFNSHAIESNLHRIPDLSEYFIYFNDDMLLGSIVTQDEFFTSDGKIKLRFSSYTSATGSVAGTDSGWRSGWKNTNVLLDSLFHKESRKVCAHAPLALKKSLIEEIEKKIPHIFKAVSAHTFRSFSDYTMTNGLIPYYAYYTQQGTKGTLRSKTLRLNQQETRLAQNLKKIAHGKYHTFCLEDVQAQNEEGFPQAVNEFLESYFPEKAPWEK